jgi:hypothetical protein
LLMAGVAQGNGGLDAVEPGLDRCELVRDGIVWFD